MGRNVEIKARIDDPEAIGQELRAMAAHGPQLLLQHDVFYGCRRGRLKLRRFDDGSGELIAYDRADDPGPRTSHYQLVPCADPDSLAAALGESLGVLGEVRKRRTLWMLGRTRIHLDEVAGLGNFMEIEVVLGNSESETVGEREADRLMRMLGVPASSLVSEAYVDLLLRGDST